MARRNLCLNPALSVDVTGWGGGSTPTRTAVTGFGRSWAARYTAGTYASTAATATNAVTVGQTYTVSVYLRPATFNIGSGSIYIEWINGSGSGFGYPAASYSAAAGTVTRVSVTAVAPANAVACRVIVDGANFSVNTGDLTMVLIEQAATLADYFDGDSSSASWDGTPGLSSSTLTDAVTGTSTTTLPAPTATAAGTPTSPATGITFLPVVAGSTAGTITAAGTSTNVLPLPTLRAHTTPTTSRPLGGTLIAANPLGGIRLNTGQLGGRPA